MAGEIYGFAIKVEEGAVKSIDAIDSSLIKLEGHSKEAESGFKNVFKGFLGAEAVIKSFSMIKEGISSVLSTGIQMEQTGIAFEVMLGSAKKGREMTSELKKWADITPFDNQTAFDAGRLLLNYGVSAQKIIPYMSMLGDASGGVKDRFDRMLYAFSQVSAAGRLQGQDLRQLIDAGFNPLQELSKMTGKSMLELKKDMEAGKITFDTMISAFQHATGEGGRFNNMMLKQSQTVGGLWSTIQSYGQNIATGLFQRIAPTLKDLEKNSLGVAKSLGEWITPKQSEVLKDQKTEMMGLFEAVKDGNTPTEIRKDLIQRLNTEFKDYLPNLITERDTIDQIAQKQERANKAISENIKLEANREIVTKYESQKAAAQEALANLTARYQEYAHGYISGIDKSSPMFRQVWNTLKLAVSDQGVNALFSDQTVMGLITGDNSYLKQFFKQGKEQQFLQEFTKQSQKYQDALRNLAKARKDFGADAFEKTTPLEFQTGNEAGVMAGAAGGLGSVKQININMDKWMQVNTGSMDSKDLQKTNETGFEQFIREIHNMMSGVGNM